MEANQTFFISAAIRQLRLSVLPLSNELGSVLRKLRISTFGDMTGVSLREFQHMSDRGTSLFLEIGRLIERTRQGDFAASLAKQPRLQQTLTRPRFPQVPKPLLPIPAARQTRPINAKTVSESPQDETIFIPQEARGKLLASVPVSVRLRHILQSKQFRLFGDLHGRRFSEFVSYRNFGKRTLDELRELVRAIQHEHHATAAIGQTGVVVQEAPPAVVADAFFVPANLHNLSVCDLPLSVRLEGVLQQKGVLRLGDLHGVALSELWAIENCGKKTLAELARLIERAASGEFHTGLVAWNPAELVRTLDALVADLPQRNQKILALRLGGKGEAIPTLEELGTKFRLTRERVRQIVGCSVARIGKLGSRRLNGQLEHLKELCDETLCPLTPALLAQWLGQSPAVCSFQLVFYVRLLAELSPAILAWPSGQQATSIREPRSEEIEQALESVLRDGFRTLSLHDAFCKLRSETSVRGVSAIEFLATLQHARRFKVEFTTPDAPVVRLTRHLASDVAKAILQASASPLTPEEILARAQRTLGQDSARWNPRTLGNSFLEEKGFYLLGPRAYGLRQHFRLPQGHWNGARDEMHSLLRKENRPISTSDIVNAYGFHWASQTNKHELAYVLREDERFVDLGRLLFGLTEWGVEEREYVKDLIPKLLQKAGRPLTGTEVLARLQQLRSSSPTSIASSLRKHPEVRDYGFGHYGLKCWGDSVKGGIVTDAALVQRVIRRAVPPLTFVRLCEILDVPAAGELAEKLWQTCAALPEVLRLPEERSETARLIHRSCRLERALVATACEVNRPLPLYEFQWELNERFGPLFATKPLDDLRRGLEQSLMFLRDAADEFILDIHLDQLGLDADAIRRACAEILSESKEIVGCEDLLERLEADGKSWEDLSPDILASLLRDDATFQEVGRDRFRVKSCKP